MPDCRIPCSYCGLAPCVGYDRCPQWDQDDDDEEEGWWESPDDGYDDDDDDPRDDPCDPCLWCGDVTYPGDGGICEHCAWGLGQEERKEDVT